MNPAPLSTTYAPPAEVVILTQGNAGRREGERRKNAALDLLAARRETFVRQGQRALLAALLAGKATATADDVRAAVNLPPDLDPRLLGAVPRTLALAGIVRADGFVKSTRPERHASYLQCWRLLDAAAAQLWLDKNPELPDLDAEPRDDLPLWQSTNVKRPTAGTAGRSMQSPST